MNSPAPVNIATLRKLITLNPRQKNVCTVCHKKMRAPGADEEPTPTCDNCAQDIVVEILPRLLNEIEAARAAVKPAPKPAAVKPVRKKAVKAKAPKPAKKVEPERPKREKPKLRVVPKEPESETKPIELTSEHELELLDAVEQSKKPEPEPEVEEPEVDEATDVSELALKLEEEKKDEPRRRRIVKFVPAEPKEVQAAVVRLREKFET